MRRADRLFQLIQILRRSRRPVTAAMLAAELEVSPRTVYRDVADLVGQRVPISGEAGYGYVLSDDYDMPPLMLTRDEIEAVVLGAQWVAGHADRTLAGAAQDVIAKIAAAIPDDLRAFVLEPSVGTRPMPDRPAESVDADLLRTAIRTGRKLRLVYRAGSGEETERTIRPVVLGYADTYRMLIGWCELRGDFRHFRTDRITAATILENETGEAPDALRRRWEVWRRERLDAAPPSR